MKKTLFFFSLLSILAIGFSSTNGSFHTLAAGKTYPDGTGYPFKFDNEETATPYINGVGYGAFSNRRFTLNNASATTSSQLAINVPYNHFQFDFTVQNTGNNSANWLGVTLNYSSCLTYLNYSNPLIYFDTSGCYSFINLSKSKISSSTFNTSSYSSTSYDVRLTYSGTTMNVYMAEANQSLNLLGSVTINHSNYFALSTTEGNSYYSFSKISCINLDHEYEDLTPKTPQVYKIGKTLSGNINAPGSVSYSLVEDNTDGQLSFNTSTGEYTFTPKANALGQYRAKYSCTNGDKTLTGTLIFNQRMRENTPLLTPNTPKELHNYYFGGYDHDTMPIIGYVAPQAVLGTNTDGQYAILKESGLNGIVGLNESYDTASGRSEVDKALGYADKYGIQYIVRTDDSTPTKAAYFDSLKQHSSFAGFFTKDEPSMAEFPYSKTYFDNMRGTGYINYANLLPNYASSTQLSGNGRTDYTYDNYVSDYMSQVNPEYVSFDHYCQIGTFPNIQHNYFDNLYTIRAYSEAYKVPWWSFNLTTANVVYRTPTEADLNWEVNTSLCYGAKGVLYFCYQTPNEFSESGGSFVTKSGTKTSLFDYGKKVNKQVSSMDHILMNCERVGTYQGGSGHAQSPTGASTFSSAVREINSFTVSSGACLMGVFDYNGHTAIYLANNRLTDNCNVTIGFNSYVEGNYFSYYGDSTFSGNSVNHIIGPGQGVLMELTNYTDSVDPVSAEAATVTIPESSYTYTGSPITPTPTVTLCDITMTQDVDYKVEYANNVEVGTATLTIDFNEGTSKFYKGKINKTFEIVSGVEVVAPKAKSSLVYTSKEQELIEAGSSSKGEMKYCISNSTPTIDKYSTSIPKGKAAQTYKVWYIVLDGETPLISPVSIDVNIAKLNISLCKIELSNTDFRYDGSSHKPTINSVKYNDNSLDVDEVFVSSYTNSNGGLNNTTNAGVITMVIEGNSNFDGSVNKSYTINGLVIVFIDNYMHMDSSTSGTCYNYYPLAKNALNNDTSYLKEEFMAARSGSNYSAALERYEAWARANGDITPFEKNITKSSLTSFDLNSNVNLIYVLIISSLVITLISTISIISYKNKRNKKNKNR